MRILYLSLIVLMVFSTFILVGCKDMGALVTVIADDISSIGKNKSNDTSAIASSDVSVKPVCGNGKLEAKEQCDGSVPAGISCQGKNYTFGTVGCSNQCTLDYSGCTLIGCVDTDGGVLYTVKGTVTVETNGVQTNYTDYCRHGSYEDYILEYSCGTRGAVSESYRCIKGCNNNGACW